MSYTELYAAFQHSWNKLADELSRELLHTYSHVVDSYDDWQRDPSIAWADLVFRKRLVPLIVTLVLTIYIVGNATVALLFGRYRRQKALEKELDEKDHKRAILKKLLTVLTPTRSIWSKRHWELAQHAAKTQLYSMPLPFFIDGLIKGETELRNPRDDLPELVMGRLEVEGLKIRLERDYPLANRVAAQGFYRRFSSVNSQTLLHSSHSFNSDSHTTPAVITTQYLDRIPVHQLQSFIRLFQASIPVGSTVMLGFSSRGHLLPPSQRSHHFTLAALPFLPRKHISKTTSSSSSTQREPRTALRTLIPLHTTLENTIFLLTSGLVPLTIQSVQNTSEDYVAHLDAYADKLVYNIQTRAAFQNRWGMEGWREEIFVTNWEAALVRAELLTRWAVVVERRV